MNWIAAKLLSVWWSSPTTPIVEWLTEDWWESALKIWRELALPENETVQNLWFAAKVEERCQIQQEYERLFVGPAFVPCPPYEAVWQTNRPRQEQGMTTGEATLEVRRLYAEYGLCMKNDRREFPDHIAIEFEALANAWKTTGEHAAAEALVQDHLGKWIPQFCTEVMKQTNLDFYRILAALTVNLTRLWSNKVTN